MTEAEIREQYPSLPTGAVRAALAYAAILAREELHPVEPAAGEVKLDENLPADARLVAATDIGRP